MSRTINYIEDKQIVRVNFEGRVNFSTAQKYSKEALKTARDYNSKKFLFDHTRTLLEAGIYKIHADGDTLEKFGFDSSDKIAIVIAGDKSDGHFFETNDSNVKWSNFKYFNNVEDAVFWLEEND